MQKVKKTVFTLLIIFSVVGGASFYYFWSDYNKTEQIIRKREKAKALIEATLIIEKVWREGVAKDIDCDTTFLGDYRRVNQNYLRCNPDFLSCWMKKSFPRQFRGENIHILNSKIGKNLELVSRDKGGALSLPTYGIRINLQVDQSEIQSILLENSCSDTYLPERIYGYGPYARKDWRWDNFGRHLFVDRFLVTNRDVNEWIDHSNNPEAKSLQRIVDPKNIPLAATHLNLKQMEAFCQFRGKELLKAHIFDAAAFHPGDYENSKPKKSFRGPYPWSRKRKDSFLYKASIDNQFPFELKFCEKVFTEECENDFIFDAYAPLASSWTGIVSTLGGVMEAFRNPIEKRKNLKISSLYYPIHSFWHRLGLRSFWDGEGHEFPNIDWRDASPIKREGDKYKIGFRCMKRRSEIVKN